ncbi:MAG: hypothetical protein IPK50_15655 [Fibrobacterota bacterium]|nr:MAG: hypothetical protein IPK50_15655 [Fibrobacterota bacterium]
MISACEVSGDGIAARIAPALRECCEEPILAGSCGSAMRRAGVECLARAEDFSHVGWVSVLRDLPRLAWKTWRYFRKVEHFAPKVAVLVDAPGLHGPLAQRLRRRGVEMVWVAPPQLWAWKDRQPNVLRGMRVHPMHRFEVGPLRRAQADAHWLGFPGGAPMTRAAQPDLLALLPGSRPGWRSLHRTLFLEAVLALDLPLRPVFVHPHPPSSMELGIECLSPDQALPRAALALSLPGTGALELARLGVPTLLAARPRRLDAFFAHQRLDPGFKGLPNRILGVEVFPERFSTDLTPKELAGCLVGVWERRAETRERLESFEGLLWAQDAERRIAGSIAEIVHGG